MLCVLIRIDAAILMSTHSIQYYDKGCRDVFLIFYKIMVCCVYSLESTRRIDAAILMSTHSIQYHDKIENFPKTSLNICFLSYPRDPKLCSNQSR